MSLPCCHRTHQQKQAACCPPPPSRFAQYAAPTARRQGGNPELPPLTVLVSAAFSAQRDGSGGSRLSRKVYICMPSPMGISNCR
jgi:hypothetical protein